MHITYTYMAASSNTIDIDIWSRVEKCNKDMRSKYMSKYMVIVPSFTERWIFPGEKGLI
jgi:hypothetical protein